MSETRNQERDILPPTPYEEITNLCAQLNQHLTNQDSVDEFSGIGRRLLHYLIDLDKKEDNDLASYDSNFSLFSPFTIYFPVISCSVISP